jgi:hypothetical protein
MADFSFNDVLNSAISVTWEIIKYFAIFMLLASVVFTIGIWLFIRWLFSEGFTSNTPQITRAPSSKDYLRAGVLKLQRELGVNLI